MWNRTASVVVASTFWLLCACPVVLAQLGPGPETTTMREHAYEGARRPASQIATVFAPYGDAGQMTFICSVDGRSYLKLGWTWTSSCPSVVYLLPGAHQLMVNYRFGYLTGTTTIPIRVEA